MSKKLLKGPVASILSIPAVVLLAAAPAQAALTPVNPADGCAQTLSAAGQYVLTGNLACPGGVSGIIIDASNVVFHLAGHTISSTDCNLSQDLAGIFVTGGHTGVQISGGTISGFNDGIILSSSNSRVRGMTVTGSCVFGILVGGADNQVDTNVVTANASDGIMLAPANGALITANDTSGNGRAGIAISDVSDNNVVRGNISNNNGGGGEGYGVALFNGTNALIEDNVANKNDFGIRLSGVGGGNFVRRNAISGSTLLGIFVTDDVAPVSIRLNTVLGSGIADMSDDSAGCAGNVWRKNTFQTDLVAGSPNGGPGGGCIR